jgi:hypothetical protein
MIRQACTRQTNERTQSSATRGRALDRHARAAFLALALTALVSGLLAPTAATAQEGESTLFAVGDRVAVTAEDGLNLRDGQGEDAELVETLPLGAEATVLALPATGSDDGFDWYQLETDDGVTGWAVGEFLELIAPADDADGVIPIGSTVAVGTDGLHLRAEAGLESEVIDTLSMDTEAVIDSAPVEVDELVWYRVSIGNREIFGWVAGEFLIVVADPPVIEIGDMVAVNTDLLTLRDGASLDADTLDTLHYGFAATVIDGPVEADGFTWFQIESDDVTGWVAGAWLTAP